MKIRDLSFQDLFTKIQHLDFDDPLDFEFALIRHEEISSTTWVNDAGVRRSASAALPSLRPKSNFDKDQHEFMFKMGQFYEIINREKFSFAQSVHERIFTGIVRDKKLEIFGRIGT